MNWEDAYHTEALKAREAAARVDALISELGDNAAAAVDAEADGADSGNGFRHITVLLHETVDMLEGRTRQIHRGLHAWRRRPYGTSAGAGSHCLGH